MFALSTTCLSVRDSIPSFGLVLSNACEFGAVRDHGKPLRARDGKMRYHIIAAIFAASTATLPAQSPPACACTQVNYVSSASNSAIGSASTDANCTVVTIGLSVYCRVSGIITLNYNPVNFALTSAQWATPVRQVTCLVVN